MKKIIAAGTLALAGAGLSSAAFAESPVYMNFPVTVKGYTGDKTSSVAYTGQIARQLLSDSLKKLAGQGNGAPNPALKAKMLAYYEGKDAGREILAQKTKGPFVVAQTMVDEIGKGSNLAGKTFKGTIAGMPNNLTGPELVGFWIDKASAADKGFDGRNGYDYPQLISKFLLGAVFYNQVVDNYLDENLEADKKPNDKPYREGAYYTGKEHSWDEGFGYFGVPAHALNLTPRNVYDIAKLGGASDDPKAILALADHDKDGKVDLYREMAYGPAYYAAGADLAAAKAKRETNYLHGITKAFHDGRALLAAANGKALTDTQRSELKRKAAIIETLWEQSLAEAVFKYAGSVYKDLNKIKTIDEASGNSDKTFRTYVKHWGELKGFALALQTGRKNLGETATRLNRLIGFGPVLRNSSQVVDVDRAGNYVKDQASFDEYMVHMVKVQRLMIDAFDVKARANDVTDEMAALLRQIGGKSSAEND